MKKILSVAVLGSTGYVGLELVKILIRHPNIQIKFLGCENSPSKDIREFDQNIVIDTLPKLDLNNNFDPKNYDLVFLSLCLLYTSPSPRDRTRSRMPSSA